ncbi:MAG: iron-sulfur cluster assembly accessory protein [Alphaproteobacteria bacterium CG_4_10_14_0_2_um_filter_63_37]|nr:MAG: hypothetical protein AUJ55_06160 [Proteobacteria bacterium CG1_02_64_396]PJA23842.1 MAG: iron-sulfur cluster assembly accessory protein [Alphaproteobacteria bacterium CG_4_10_14_0_2_um_filter_63_37]
MIQLTDKAISAVSTFIKGSPNPNAGLRIMISGGGCSGFQYGLSLEDEPGSKDTVLEFGAVKVFIDPDTTPFIQGTTVDFTDGMEGSGFKFENPNAKSSCGCGKSFSC